MVDLILFWPRTACLGAIMGLVVMADLRYCQRHRRMVLALAILSPLAPLLLMRAALFVGIMLIDRLTPRHRLMRAAAEYIGGRYGEV